MKCIIYFNVVMFWTWQELATFTHSCKKCLAVIEMNHQTIQKIVHSNKTLQHMDMSLLQKRVADLQVSSQVGNVYVSSIQFVKKLLS